MDRRVFLKLTGFVAAASAFEAVPVAAADLSLTAPVESFRDLGAASSPSVTRLRVHAAGTYQITGTVRLEAPIVEISGITNAQQISWSGAGAATSPLSSFSSFETYASSGLTPEIQVRGGRLESISIVPVEYQ